MGIDLCSNLAYNLVVLHAQTWSRPARIGTASQGESGAPFGGARSGAAKHGKALEFSRTFFFILPITIPANSEGLFHLLELSQSFPCVYYSFEVHDNAGKACARLTTRSFRLETEEQYGQYELP